MHPSSFLLLLLSLLVGATVTIDAHNITHILADHPEFSTFNHYLTTTHLAAEINRRRTITVCALDNSAMNELLASHYPLPTIKNILSLHIFADYFGSKKLHQITKGSTTTSSLFQATGEADGTSGYVNITDMKGGKVGFSPVDSDPGTPMATYVKSIKEFPYDVSVIQISRLLTSPEAEAPTAGPADLNVTLIMAKQGCKAFSDLVTAQGAADTFAQSVAGGLTVFCPSDEALESFGPKYRNLTGDGKTSLLLYHGVPEYNSLGTLRSSNGVMNTLATEGASRKFDFTVQNDGDDVKLETKVVTATIEGTLIDDDPLVVYKIDKVLQPRELFKAAAAAATAHAPKSAKSKAASADEDEDSPEPSADDATAADEESTSNECGRVVGGGYFLTLGLAMGIFFTGVF